MKLRLFTLLLALWTSLSAWAQIQAIPPNVAPDPKRPMILLNVSKDFSMFSRAYTDYDDLDFDGVIDYYYKPNFTYYGYFDSTKCYTYSSSNSGLFVPGPVATVENGKYYCATASANTSIYWSGNFLNWATMSRIDVLRKILYGGLRSTDSTTQTVLELSFVPRNTQAFVKFYNGADLIRLTPFKNAQGITLCRRHANVTSSDSSADKLSQTTTKLPQLRVAKGNVLLWNMTEVRSCNWDEEVSYTWAGATTNFITNTYAGAGGTSPHLTKTPRKNNDGATYTDSTTLGPEFTTRVEVCNAAALGSERCTQYPNGNLKPTGLLNEFGESANFGNTAARAEFALIMGSFDNNLNGGLLRKNMEEINNEINPSTGQFDTSSSNRGLIYSLNELTLYGYNLDSGNYTQTCNSETIANGDCPSWGNPVSEILLEGLRYYAGKSALYTSGSKDNEFGFPKPTWLDPLTSNRTYSTGKTRLDLYGKHVCRPLNMINISSGISTFDDNGMSSFAADLGAPSSAATYTNQIGQYEGLQNTIRLIGNNGITNDGLCTGKTISQLGNVKGLCPDAPNMRGTYLGAGAAFYAHTNRIRSLTLPSDAKADALKVRQYAISMNGGLAQIRIPVPGTQPQRYVFITPASLDSLYSTTSPLAGNLVDFKVLQMAADGLSGTFIALWQHYMLGEDQDQDMMGTIRYSVNTATSPPTLSVWTQTLESDTGSTVPYLFGYTLVGSTADGFHSHSAINNGAARDTTATYANSQIATGGAGDAQCNSPRKCVVFPGNRYVYGETRMNYTMIGSEDVTIKDPLWYVAKYGGFKDNDKNPTGLPDATSKWDVKRSDGQPCGASGQPSCSDGIPDNYFLARRPDLLEQALREVLLDIVTSSNAAPAVSRPDLRSGDLKYVAQFDPGDLHGELLAYQLLSSGTFDTTPFANGHEKLTNTLPANRQIIINVGTTGIPFTYSAINAASGGSTLLNSLGTGGTVSTMATARINYFRGSRSDEKPAGQDFRTRNTNSILGTIVNSNPWLQDRPVANLFGTQYPNYGTFKTSKATRDRLVWVGANDGMLHAFKAQNLDPVMSYIPGNLGTRLKDLTDPSVTNVVATMDGSPFVGDVMVGSNWASYLFSALGRGGKGIFALDVTDTGSLTESRAAQIFKWQFDSTNDADLGYILSESNLHPQTGQASQITKLPNGKFAVLFGNGVQSTSGNAVLYILFVDGPASGTWTSGTHYVKLTAASGPNNGLMQPYWLDSDGDGLADTIYAGDMKGNLWKFDVSSTDPVNWKVAYNKPLFQAVDSTGAALPITTSPLVQFHPMGGQVVTFGTGKAVVTGDFPDTTRTYRIFGIWDKPSYTSAPSTIPSGTSQLQQRVWAINTSGNLTQSSTTAIDWTSKKGWYIDIPYSSGMVIHNPDYAQDGSKDVAFTLVYPTNSTPNCSGGAVGVFTQFNPVSGLLGADVFNFGILGNGMVIGIVSVDQRLRVSEDSSVRCRAGINCQRIIGQSEDKTTVRSTSQSRMFWREIPGLRTLD